MNLQDLKVGDRFRWTRPVEPNFHTLIEYVGNGKFVTLKMYKPSRNKVGDVIEWHLSNYVKGAWKYLGNFSKADSFETLYDLLNTP